VRPIEPVDIPAEAITALQQLHKALGPFLLAEGRFGIGIKKVGGEYQDDLALVVTLPQKLPLYEVPAEQRIPPRFGGFPTDVLQVRPEDIADTTPHDPLIGGIQISRPAEVNPAGDIEVHPGTLGAIARNRSDGALVVLTAAHVLPDAGVEVHQPADLEVGHRIVAIADRAVSSSEGLDCAVAIIVEGQDSAPVIADLGAVSSTATVALWESVSKRGAATGLTSGLVVAVFPDLSTGLIGGMIIDTFPFGGTFAWRGDSGSVIVNQRNEIVGLLHQADPQFDPIGTLVGARGLAQSIDRAMDALQIDLITS
jgi:Trypsin-like peptidase domain